MKTRQRIYTVRRVDIRWLNRQVGQRMRAQRKKRGLTLEEVGLALGVTRAAINNWELGRSQTNMLLTNVYNVALFYRVPPKSLLP